MSFLLTLALPRAARADGDAPTTDVVVTGQPSSPWTGRAATRVLKIDLEERLPRSAPDALRFEPGVFVQQTAHGQASPFIRGRTGQQTVLLFDGIRLNNSTFRQGPNQYFFTLDPRTIQAIDVLRGGASTLYGSDAIGGALHARPNEPTYDPDTKGVAVRPRAFLRFASADTDFSERIQADAQLDPVLVLVGAGFRRVGQLRSGGAVVSPTTGARPQVPAFEDDGVTQLGTGFKELTADVRTVLRLGPDQRVVGAAYVYRQYDAPRTDQCPPPFAARTDCLRVLEQFRTLTYLALEGRAAGFKASRVAISYQRQHEARVRDRPRSFVQDGGRDDVDTFGLMAAAESSPLRLSDAWSSKLGVGLDAYLDTLSSTAYTRLTDIGFVRAFSRGQYLTGSQYAQGGTYVTNETRLRDDLALRVGGRAGFARADAPRDVESSTAPIGRSWGTWSSYGQAEWFLLRGLSITGGVDRSYRAPNLDDLTSRQQAGPGFQFENVALEPERGVTFEGGARYHDLPFVQAEAWVYRALLYDAITRTTRQASDCPPSTPQCAASFTRLQLVNTPGASTIDGAELALRVRPLRDVALRGTFAYAYGEGPNPQARPTNAALPYEERVPLSRIAPPNGTFDVRVGGGTGAYAGGSLRWALAQTRLAITDRSDARIPEGGTPGFAVVDLRAGYRWSTRYLLSAVLENVGNAAYRYHGSSINGPGRGIIVSFESGL